MFAGLLANAGLIAKVEPPEATVASAVTVYIKFIPYDEKGHPKMSTFIPAILKVSLACGAEVKPSRAKVVPV